MLDKNDNAVRAHLLEGSFGLERESLRITSEGRIAHTPHPFPGNERIVRDFCENQTEINTGVHSSAAAAVAELREALVRRFIAPLARPRMRRVGVELELPIVALKGNRPVDFGIVHMFTGAFLNEFGFEIRERDERGFIYHAADPAHGDELSYDCSYNTLEFSFAPEEDLNALYARFVRYYSFAEEFLRRFDHSLCGSGINPKWRINRAEPIASSRYRMLLQHLESAPDYAGARIVPFHSYPHFGLFSCASQVQLDVDESNAVKAVNAFTLLEPFKAVLFANSPFGDGFTWQLGRDYLWRNSLHGLNPHNCDLYRLPFRSLDEITNYQLTTSIYCVARDGRYVHFAPTPIADYVNLSSVTGWAEEATGPEVVTFTPSAEDVQFLRPFKFEDITHRGTVEFRSVCEQPISEVMTVAAFHAGLFEELDKLATLVENDTVLYGHGYDVSELRELFCHREYPGFVDRAELSRQLLAILELARSGLAKRGLGEERFLEPLHRRAETLRSPAIEVIESIERGEDRDEILLRNAKL